MKKTLFISLFVLISTIVFSQYDELPSAVDNAFKEKYPKAKNVDWYFEDNNYRIEFELKLTNHIAIFSEEGTWIESVTTVSDVPVKVTKGLNKKYPDHEISNAEYVETNKGEKYYRINSYDDNADYLIRISPEGVIIDNKKIADYSDDSEEF